MRARTNVRTIPPGTGDSQYVQSASVGKWTSGAASAQGMAGHEVFGGIAPETIKFVAEAAARTRGRKLADHDDPSAPWSAPTLSPYLFQSISVALQTAVANQILDRVAEEDGLAALGSA